MTSNESETITVSTTVDLPVEKVWTAFTEPEHIIHWSFASPDWHTPQATNDLRVGGKFTSRMESKDGSLGFDFEGIYDVVKEHALIAYSLADGRKVKIKFNATDQGTSVTETFDAEKENPVEMQRGGWQAILDNFKKYTEKTFS